MLGSITGGDADTGTSSNSPAASSIATTSFQVMEPLLSLSLTLSIFVISVRRNIINKNCTTVHITNDITNITMDYWKHYQLQYFSSFLQLLTFTTIGIANIITIISNIGSVVTQSTVTNNITTPNIIIKTTSTCSTTSDVISIRSDDGLTLETSAF